jgi:hypothetical protein
MFISNAPVFDPRRFLFACVRTGFIAFCDAAAPVSRAYRDTPDRLKFDLDRVELDPALGKRKRLTRSKVLGVGCTLPSYVRIFFVLFLVWLLSWRAGVPRDRPVDGAASLPRFHP